MIKKDITYVDYDGNKRTETFYFSLNETELTEMQFEKQGGLKEYLEKITKSLDNVEIMKTFKTILLKAYGEKTPDGRRLVKSEEISTAFTQTPAYNVLFLELIKSGDEGIFNFISGILPDSLRSEFNKRKDDGQVLEISEKAE